MKYPIHLSSITGYSGLWHQDFTLTMLVPIISHRSPWLLIIVIGPEKQKKTKQQHIGRPLIFTSWHMHFWVLSVHTTAGKVKVVNSEAPVTGVLRVRSWFHCSNVSSRLLWWKLFTSENSLVQCREWRLTLSDASACRLWTSWGGPAEGGRRGLWEAARRAGGPMKCLLREMMMMMDKSRIWQLSYVHKLQRGWIQVVRKLFPTWCTLFFPPRPPGQDKLAAIVLFALAEEPLVLVGRWPLLDELCRGAFSVQALTQKAFWLAFVGPLGLRQHGALRTQAGQISQWHAGGRTN